WQREPRTPSRGMAAKPEPDRAHAVDGRLADDREPIQRSVMPQGDARDGDNQEWDRHESPQDLVGQELQRVEAEPPRVEQLARHRDPPQAASHDPHLAAVLALAGTRDRLECNRFGLEDEPAARADDLRRGDEVVGDTLGHLAEQLAPDPAARTL